MSHRTRGVEAGAGLRFARCMFRVLAAPPGTPIWFASQVSVAAASGHSSHVKNKSVSCQGGDIARSKAPATVLLVVVVARQGI